MKKGFSSLHILVTAVKLSSTYDGLA